MFFFLKKGGIITRHPLLILTFFASYISKWLKTKQENKTRKQENPDCVVELFSHGRQKQIFTGRNQAGHYATEHTFTNKKF